ncbi:hypothetical protein H311_03504 [Anncaliia algerae PRA109]|nr:hypothetical protein H311_03504 [Anncaliia algerae PRA109]
MITDGYPSYLSAVAKFVSDHKIVNHSKGFCNADGINTNSIENIWSHLKKDYRERAGVKKKEYIIFKRISMEETKFKKKEKRRFS